MSRSLRSVLCALCCSLYIVFAHGAQATGDALPGLEAFDQAMADIMQKWEIPGASLAVAKDGRLLLARGYGFADRDRKTPVQPTSLFRMGSIAKTITAVAVLQLAGQRRLALDDKALPLLGELAPAAQAITDPRVHDITVRQLLQHTGGFDRKKSGDPIVMPRLEQVAQRQNVSPVTCPALLRDTLEVGLDFTPGTQFGYSNVGYCMLGRIVERVSGERFEQYVRAHVLQPADAQQMRLGETMGMAPGEVRYYDPPGSSGSRAAPGFGFGLVPGPYGTLPLEMMDAFGGWIGTPTDILKIFLAIDGRRGPRLLSAENVGEMRRRPSSANKSGWFYGFGVNVLPQAGGDNWWHDGVQPGVMTLALRTADGLAWVVAFNMRPRDQNAFFADYDKSLWAAKARVTNWPSGDLF